LLRALGRQTVLLSASENRTGDCVEFRLPSGCEVLLHRASDRSWRALVELSQRIAVDLRAFRASDCNRFLSAARETRILACRAKRCIKGGCCKGDRSEKRELVPQ
jgi:hypothetical protein